MLIHCANGNAGNKLEVGVLLRCAMDICSGLQEVHAMGIIMRDLKPVSQAQLQASLHGLHTPLKQVCPFFCVNSKSCAGITPSIMLVFAG